MTERFRDPKVTAQAFQALKPFLPKGEFLTIVQCACRSSDKLAFQEKLFEVAERIATMPETYEQDGKGDEAIVYLHYFLGGSDWYITEKDMDGGVLQAFGYSCSNGDVQNAGLGYISIRELTELGVELDLHFTPCSLREVKDALQRKAGVLKQVRESSIAVH